MLLKKTTEAASADSGFDVSRRGLLKTGLLVAGYLVLPLSIRAAFAEGEHAPSGEIEITDWIRIGPDGETVLGLSQAEVGQGVHTGLPQVLADEMDADWNKVRVEFVTNRDAYRTAAAHEKLQQFVGGSMSVTMFYERLRIAGAQAREAFTAVAAHRWGVPVAQCRTHQGKVHHDASKRELAYQELIVDAASIELNPQPRLKSRQEQTLLDQWLPKLDTPEKSDGSAIFGTDVEVPDMLCAAMRMAPTLNGKPTGIGNKETIRQLPGVHEVVMAKDAVIVVADSYWVAKKACDQLDVQWDLVDESLDSDVIRQQIRDALDAETSPLVMDKGDALSILGKIDRTLTQDYHSPYIVHAPMESVNATVHVREGEIEVWAPTQGQDMVRWTLAKLFDIPSEKVTVHTTFLGGSFGRKYVPDFVVHAAVASAAVGKPVKLIRSREDDIQHSVYRPSASGRLKASLDADGRLQALYARIAGQSLYYQIKRNHYDDAGGWDETMVDGIYNVAYDIPNLHVECTNIPQNIPVSFMRTVGSTSSVFILESFISELAEQAGADQVEFRRQMLQNDPISLAVIDQTVERAGWSRAAEPGIFRGFAFGLYVGRGSAFHSYAAVAVELRVQADGRFKVERLTCGVEVGQPINHNLIASMVEGSMGFALTNTFKSEITFRKGAVEQRNFPDYRLLFLREMPHVEVVILDSDRPPQGCGEIALPPVAPAVAEAIYQATKIRCRSLPLPMSVQAAKRYEQA